MSRLLLDIGMILAVIHRQFLDIEINQSSRTNKSQSNVDRIKKPADSMNQDADEINRELIKTLKSTILY